MADKELLSSIGKLHSAIRELNAQGISVEYSMQKEAKHDYKVIISEIYTTVVPIKAISPSSAKEIALQAINEGKIKCDFGCEPEIEIHVFEDT